MTAPYGLCISATHTEKLTLVNLLSMKYMCYFSEYFHATIIDVCK